MAGIENDFWENAAGRRKMDLVEGKRFCGRRENMDFYLQEGEQRIIGIYNDCRFKGKLGVSTDIHYNGVFSFCDFLEDLSGGSIRGLLANSNFTEKVKGVDFRPNRVIRGGFDSSFRQIKATGIDIYPKTSQKTTICDRYELALYDLYSTTFALSTVQVRLGSEIIDFLTISYYREGSSNNFEMDGFLSAKPDDFISRKIVFMPLKNIEFSNITPDRNRTNIMHNTCFYMAADPSMREALSVISKEHSELNKRDGFSVFRDSKKVVEADRFAFRLIRPYRGVFNKMSKEIQEKFKRK